MTSWCVWYVQAILTMAGAQAKDLLARLLLEPEYELDAAWGLFQVARSDSPSPLAWPRNWPIRNKDLKFVWSARAGEAEIGFIEPLRSELVGLLRGHIDGLLAERLREEQLAGFEGRLKDLAVVLAEMDGRNSSRLVLDILSMPETGTWFYGAWSCIYGLEALLMSGVVLPSAKTWEILGPVIRHVRAHRYDSQQSSLLTRALCIALFTDEPGSDMERVRVLVQENLLSVEGIVHLTDALGHSRCTRAVALLRELAETGRRAQHLGDIWIDAVAQFDTEEAHNLLLSFVDPSLPAVPNDLIADHDGRLITYLAEIARRYPGVQARLFDLVDSDLSVRQAELLTKLLVELGSADALLRALKLLNDDRAGPASRGVHSGIEQAFVERLPLPGSRNAFALVPRSSNEIRSKLLDMVRNDPKRRNSAYALLSEIELWRIQHGRPDGEPRSLGLTNGLPWPPEPPV